MILFIILIVLLILAFVGTKYVNNNSLLWLLSHVYIFLFGITHVIILLGNLYTLSPLEKKELQIQYEELSKNKNNEYLIEDIIEWNKDLKFGKEFQHDKWIGIYIPNIYDDFEEIDIND